MSDEYKEPKIIYYGAEQRKIVNQIDDRQFLDLNYGGNRNSSTSRIDLFLFAMALGLETAPSEVKQPDTFIRDEYVKIKHDALLYAAFIYKQEDKGDLDCIVNKEKVYKFAQNYANTGFNLLGDMVKNKTEAVIVLEFIKELDKDYIKYFGTSAE